MKRGRKYHHSSTMLWDHSIKMRSQDLMSVLESSWSLHVQRTKQCRSGTTNQSSMKFQTNTEKNVKQSLSIQVVSIWSWPSWTRYLFAISWVRKSHKESQSPSNSAMRLNSQMEVISLHVQLLRLKSRCSTSTPWILHPTKPSLAISKKFKASIGSRMTLASHLAVKMEVSISSTTYMQLVRSKAREIRPEIKTRRTPSSHALPTSLASHIRLLQLATTAQSSQSWTQSRFRADATWMEPMASLSFLRLRDQCLSWLSIIQVGSSSQVWEIPLQTPLSQEQFKSGNFHLKKRVRSRLMPSQLQESEPPSIILISSLLDKMAYFASSTLRIETQRTRRWTNCH